MTSCLDNEIIHLQNENELQFIVCRPDDKIWLQLIEGSAEIFGSNLLLNKEYVFQYFSSVSVFSWTGCTLNLRKNTSKHTHFSIKPSTNIQRMRNLHDEIEKTRLNADATKAAYPTILLVGPSDTGKSTLCRFLLNYAVKCSRQPIFVDLDVGQSSLSIPGTFGVLPINEQSDVNGKFNERELSVYYFGYKSPGHDMTLYKLLLKNVGKSLSLRARRSQKKDSGVIIDSCGWVDGAGYKLIKEIIEMLNVNMVLVLSKESLYSRLKEDTSKKTKLIFLDKFKDVFLRNRTVRINNRDNSVYQYFYGMYGQLKPYTIKVNFQELHIFKVDFSQRSNVVPVLIDPSIIHQVLALSYTNTIEKILLTSIYGFISIIEIDMDSEIVTILSPKPSPLPTKYFIMGDITLQAKEEIF